MFKAQSLCVREAINNLLEKRIALMAKLAPVYEPDGLNSYVASLGLSGRHPKTPDRQHAPRIKHSQRINRQS